MSLANAAGLWRPDLATTALDPNITPQPLTFGGAWDAERGLLYLTMLAADREQGRYANPPVVVAYRLR